MNEGYRPGDRVQVRRERWLVTAAIETGACGLLSLRGISPANLDDERTLLVPFELIERLEHGRPAWKTGRKGWRRACRTLIADSGGWLALHRPEVGALDILAHQLEPALAVLRGNGCRVLLADDVGLGKTIQAGLIVSELMARGVVRRVLILTPASLRDQWAAELANRFGLRATVVDTRGAALLTAQLPPGDNPWNTVPIAIASIDYVKRTEILPFVRVRGWDVVVVDEAHVVTPESDRHRAISELCESAIFVVALTATPHSGDRPAFESLCTLGSHGRDDDLLVFRRGRADVRLDVERRVHRLTITASSAEAQMWTALERYASAVRLERGIGAAADRELLVTILRKRASSSPESLRQSVERRLALLSENPSADGPQLWLPLTDDAGEGDADDPPPMLRQPVLVDADRERNLLRTARDAAAAAVSGETKLAALGRLLRRLERLGEAAIVFTEYRDTLAHIQDRLGMPATVLHGGLSRTERHQAVHAFVTGASRLLLATDAAGSGLNLHHRCRVVIHLELPWNPARLEQRIGRVDRIGQLRTVHTYYLIAGESPEADMLERLRARIDRAQQDIDAANPLESSIPLLDSSPWASALQKAQGPEPAIEAQRIELARRLRARGVSDGLVDGNHHVIRARSRLRRLIGGNLLIIVGIALEDRAGRSLATQAFGLLVTANGRGPDVTGRQATMLIESASVRSAIDAVIDRMASDSSIVRDYNRFVRRIVARAKHVERAAWRQSRVYFQPGLFDRRATRLRHVLSSEQQDLAADSADRVSRFEAMAGPPEVRILNQLIALPR